MRLVRNQTEDGKCKYALVRLDKIRERRGDERREIEDALQVLEIDGVLEYGEKGSEEEFFAIKLKDIFAPAALDAYANAARNRPGAEDPEFADDVEELKLRALNHPNRKRPDTIHPVA